MLKAIVTVLDENDRILQANRLIFETNSRPVDFGMDVQTEHEFHFTVLTVDEEMMKKINLTADEIREAWKNYLYGDEKQ
jgi:hypothetical protein